MPSSTRWCGRSCSASTSTTRRSRRCARLHAEVRRDVARRELAEHVKLGPGGIREIEFIVQALQLVRGGRDPELRVRPTVKALAVLSQKSLLPESAARELTDAYVFLRNLEHRLQYLDDAQRHDLPEDSEDRARVAAMCGFSSWSDFYEKLQAVRAAGVAPLRGGLRRARGAARALARPPARRRAAREPALRRAARGVAPPARAADAGARARGASDARPGRDARPRRRPGRGDREPRRLPRAARRASRGARARRAHDRRLELGGGVHHPPSAAARRAARRPAALRARRSFLFFKNSENPARGGPRRHRAAA